METGLVPQSVRSARQTGLQWEQPVEAGPFSYSRRARPRDVVRFATATERVVRSGYVRRAGELFRAVSVGATVTDKTLSLCQPALNLNWSSAGELSTEDVFMGSYNQAAPTARYPVRRRGISQHATHSWLNAKYQCQNYKRKDTFPLPSLHKDFYGIFWGAAKQQIATPPKKQQDK